MDSLAYGFGAVPYTKREHAHVSKGIAMPQKLDKTTQQIYEEVDPERALELILGAVAQTNQHIQTILTRSQAPKQTAQAKYLHNAVVLQLIEQAMKVGRQLAENVPMVHVSFQEAQDLARESLHQATFKANGKHLNKKVNKTLPDRYDNEVDVVTDAVLNAEGQGHGTHGIIRLERYVLQVLKKLLKPFNEVERYSTRPGIARFDGHDTFGQVAVQVATEFLIKQLLDGKYDAYTVTAKRMGHAGRLEYIMRQAVEKQLSGVAMANVEKSELATFEPEGKVGKWGTNPLCIGMYTDLGPIIHDTATVNRPEGWVKKHYESGLPVPLGVIRDADGTPTITAADLYDRGGILLPLGSALSAYKGAGLGLLIQLYVYQAAGNLKGEKVHRGCNNLWFNATRPGDPTFEHVNERFRYLKGAKRGQKKPRIPGFEGWKAWQKAQKKGFDMPEGIWASAERAYQHATGREWRGSA